MEAGSMQEAILRGRGRRSFLMRDSYVTANPNSLAIARMKARHFSGAQACQLANNSEKVPREKSPSRHSMAVHHSGCSLKIGNRASATIAILSCAWVFLEQLR